MLTYQLNHFFANNAFYELKFSYTNSYRGSYLYKDPTDSRYIHDKYSANRDHTGFVTGGQQKEHNENTTEKYLARLDFTWQITNSQSIDGGAEGTYYYHNHRSQEIVNRYRNTAASALIYEPEVLPELNSICRYLL